MKFRNRNILLSAQFLSEIGDWVVFSALMLQIYNITHSPILVSLLMVSQNVMIIFASGFGGIIADRYNPKMLMIVTDILRALMIILIPFVFNTIWLIYPILMLVILCSCIFNPAKMKVIRRISSDDELATINSYSFAISGVVKILGFLFGGLLIGFYGYKIPYYLDSLTYILSCIILTFISYPYTKIRAERQQQSSFYNDFKSGISELKGIPFIPRLIIIFTTGSFIIGMIVTQLVVFNSQSLSGNELTFGYLNGAIAAGMIIVSAFYSKYAKNWEPYLTIIFSAFLGIGTSLILITTLPYPYVLVVMFLLGFFQTLPNLVALTLCQKIVPETFLGRFFGVLNIFTTSFYVIGMLLGGTLATLSVTWMYRGLGFFSILVFIIAFVYRDKFLGREAGSNAKETARSFESM
ncbi:MFS transporter [Brevibacillus sp. NRS-1366]|uniref:MFS transporter n=1 Tax=Brevibacillus sp. NRS-1366 TaxID=3233899 RepID=UPI003D1DCD6B